MNEMGKFGRRILTDQLGVGVRCGLTLGSDLDERYSQENDYQYIDDFVEKSERIQTFSQSIYTVGGEMCRTV